MLRPADQDSEGQQPLNTSHAPPMCLVLGRLSRTRLQRSDIQMTETREDAFVEANRVSTLKLQMVGEAGGPGLVVCSACHAPRLQ